MINTRTILWRRIDQPGFESARLSLDEVTGHLSGSAIFLDAGHPCRLQYQVALDPDWRTQSARVEGWVGPKEVDIELSVDPESRWRINGEEISSVEGCLDIDLNFSPSTNVLPIRRLALDVGQQAHVRVAWLRFPSFALEPIDQVYHRIAESTYRYESGSFEVELPIDEAGFVISYPDYWEAEAIS